MTDLIPLCLATACSMGYATVLTLRVARPYRPALHEEPAEPLPEPLPEPTLTDRLDRLESDWDWVNRVKHAEIATGIVALQDRVSALEGRLPSVPGALTSEELLLDQRVAALENELKFHTQTKHAELEQGFRRLEAAVEAGKENLP